MATTKTLTPTNQAITLAAFTEKPDNRTNVTNDDKLADAVNTLNSKFTPQTGDLITISTLTPIRADVIKYSVSGNVCTIFINNLQFDRSISSDTVILTCPIKPKYHTRFLILDQNNNIMNSYVSANTGDIITTGYTSGKYMYGSVSFVIAN